MLTLAVGCGGSDDGTDSPPGPPPTHEPGFLSTFGEIEFVWIPPGRFVMGSSARGDETPAHEVEISRGFWLSKYEITQEQWTSAMGSNPSHFEGENFPVDSVSWDMCQEFCSELMDQHGGVYRLPTEAEWEYACRAGTTTKYNFGDDEDQLDSYAWHPGNGGDSTHPVGKLKPNAWGLHDMHGNVLEWCQDTYMGYPRENSASPIVDPAVFTERTRMGKLISFFVDLQADRVLRGGAYNWPDGCDSAYRTYFGEKAALPYMGVRIVREAS